MKILELLKRVVVHAIQTPLTSSAGIASVVLGVDLIIKGKVEVGSLAILNGAGLILGKELELFK